MRGLIVSLGDVIDPDHQIELYHDQIAFQSTFLIRICSWIVATISIKSWPDYIKFDQNRSTLYQNCSNQMNKVKIN